jgi:hypothetical protein
VCITISSDLSATFQSAQNAARALEGQVDVRVVDSRSITLGLGSQVIVHIPASRWQLVAPTGAGPFALYFDPGDGTPRVTHLAEGGAQFGLDDPMLVIHVDMGNMRYRLRLGVEAPSPKGAHYLEIAGEGTPNKAVVLVSKSLDLPRQHRQGGGRRRWPSSLAQAATSRSGSSAPSSAPTAARDHGRHLAGRSER